MIENHWGEHGKKWCDHSDGGTLKLAVSEERADVVNWFFICWYSFPKIKSW